MFCPPAVVAELLLDFGIVVTFVPTTSVHNSAFLIVWIT